MPDGTSIKIYEITASGPFGQVFSSADYGVIQTRREMLDMVDNCVGEETITVTLNGRDVTKQALRDYADMLVKHRKGDIPLDWQKGAFEDAFDAAIRDYNFPEVAV